MSPPFICILFVIVHISSAREKTIRHYSYDPKCPTACPVLLKNNSTGQIEKGECELVRSTPLCVAAYNETVDAMPPCPDSLLHFNAIPFLFHQPELYGDLKLTQLNLSVVIQRPVEAFKLELECLHGTPNEILCISPGQLTKGTVHTHHEDHWPCRFFDFRRTDGLTPVFPSAFHYACLRAHPHTLFRINVTIYPQMCESNFFMKIPFSKNLAGPPEDWLPLPVVDTSPEDGVWIRFNPPEGFQNISAVEIQLLKRSAVGREEPDKRVVEWPKYGCKFWNLEAGQYQATLRPLCDGCREQISIAFWLTESKLGSGWSRGLVFHDISLPLSLAILGLLIAGVLAVAVFVVYFRVRRRPLFQMPEFLARPTLLLLYTDDSPEHLHTVLTLASFLKDNANVTVLLDVWALSVPRLSPDRWLLDSFNQADFCLFVFSDATRSVLDGLELPRWREREWVDLFVPGLELVSRTYLQDGRRSRPTEPLDKYLWVRFEYSSEEAVPALLRHLPVRRLTLLKDLRRLVCLLHHLPYSEMDQREALNCANLQDAMERTKIAYRSHSPNWLSNGLVQRREVETGESLERMRRMLESLSQRQVGPSPRAGPSIEEAFSRHSQANAHLLPPPPEEEEESVPMYPLIGRLEDVSSEESEDDAVQFLRPDV